LYWLLTLSQKEVFTIYNFHWKIEKYYWHIKTWCNLEDIQIEIFKGGQSIAGKPYAKNFSSPIQNIAG
jgi:hypothetical protein